MNDLKLAIKNISKLGDTDVFPFPAENMIFYDNPAVIEAVLQDIENKFDEWLSK
jgi:hypothetical protein